MAHHTRRFSRRGSQKINGVGAGSSAREWEKTPSYYRLCSLLGSEQQKTRESFFHMQALKVILLFVGGAARLRWIYSNMRVPCRGDTARVEKFINLGPNLGKCMRAVIWYSKTFRKKTALWKSTPFLRGLLFSSSSWAQLPRQIEARSAERKRCMSEGLLESERPAAQLVLRVAYLHTSKSSAADNEFAQSGWVCKQWAEASH